MVQKYYNTVETAKILGKSTEDVKQMMEGRQLHGYRDGADWKFKAEDIDQLAKQPPQPSPPAQEGGDVLLSEVELGQSDLGLSGTVIGIGTGGRAAADSDVQLDEDSEKAPAAGEASIGGSTIDLGGEDADDDLVLGGSSTGSGVAIGGDSGISLIDPADSGLSLETPIPLGAATEESLELGEDDLLAAGETADQRAAAQAKNDDLLLTPLEEITEAEDSQSGPQAIALEAAEEDEGAATGAAGVSMAAMLDEDFAAQPTLDMGESLAGVPALGGQPGALAEGAAMPSTTLLEAPYTGWQIAGLAVCTVLLMFCGMMMFDLLRNMWSWQGAYPINSGLMDTILGWIGM